MNTIGNEQEIIRQLAALPREIAPAKDVWPLISARIFQTLASSRLPARQFHFWPIATAASLFMILAAGIFLAGQRSGPELASPGKELVTSSSPAQNRPDLNVSALAGELEYQATLKEFMAFSSASGSVEGLKSAWIEQGWGTLRQVEIELMAALREQPDNSFLNLRMAALRSRQIDLLKQIATADRALRRNTT